MNNLVKKAKDNIIIIACALFIVIYPLVWSFFGLDTSDTGTYMYWYENPNSEYISLLTYFPVIIGSYWLKLFPNLGLWGLNLLEVFVLWLTSYFTFKMLNGVLGKKITIIGIVFSVALTTTYIRIFNFHQMNMLIQVLLAYTIYLGFKKNDKYFLISGALIGLSIFVRVTTILSILYLPVIIIFGFIRGDKLKIGLKRAFYTLIGMLIATILILILYFILGVFSKIGTEIVRLNNLGKSRNADSIYSYRRLIKFFIIDISYTAILGAFAFGLILLNSLIICRINISYKGFIKNILITMIIFFTSVVYNLLTFYYGVFPNGWAKLSGYTWMIHGILFTVGFASTIHYIFISKSENKTDVAMISLLGISSMWLTFVGTGVRLRHVIIGTWLLFPLLLYTLINIYKSKNLFWKKHFSSYEIFFVKNVSLSILSFLLVSSTIQYCLTVNMYDEERFWMMNSIIHNKKLSNIRTTKNQANSIQEVMDYFNSNNSKYRNYKLMVFGNSTIFYSILEMKSFVHPWVVVPSYRTEEFKSDLQRKIQVERYPIIILNKTNPYYGFSDEDYIDLLENEAKNSYNGKKKILLEFIKDKYILGFENEYFKVLIPN